MTGHSSKKRQDQCCTFSGKMDGISEWHDNGGTIALEKTVCCSLLPTATIESGSTKQSGEPIKRNKQSQPMHP